MRTDSVLVTVHADICSPGLGISADGGLLPKACKYHTVHHRCDHSAGMQLLHSNHASTLLLPMFYTSSPTPTDSLPQQHHQQQDQQQLQGSSQQPTEPRSSPCRVRNDSSPGCRLVFDIDSDSQDLLESAPLTQQGLESSEHNGSQQHMLQQAQQQQQALLQGDRRQTSGSGIGFVINETSNDCQLECDIDSESHLEELAQQAQQQQPISKRQASRSIEGQAATDASEACRLVFDIDSDPQDSPEQPLRHVTWQPTLDSHGTARDPRSSGYCRVRMSQHESQLTDGQALGAADDLHAVYDCLTHQVSSLVSHSAKYQTPGLQQHSHSDQTPPTAPLSLPPTALPFMQSTRQQLTMSPTLITAAGRLHLSGSDPQASPPAHDDLLMPAQETNSQCHLEAAEQPGRWAAATQEDDSCPLIFEEEELGITQEEDEELGVTHSLCCLASSGLQHSAKTAAMAAQDINPCFNPNLVLQPTPQSQSQHSRQQSLHSMSHDSVMRSEPIHLQHEHDSCPLVFISETDQEQHFMAGPNHTTASTHTHLSHAQGQYQHSPKCAPNSPAQRSQKVTLDGTVRPAQQRPDHMANHMTDHMANDMTGHMTAHMAIDVMNMSQDHAQYSTHPHSNVTEARGNSVSCDKFQMMPAGASIHSRQHSRVDGMSGKWGNIHGAQVSCLQLQSYVCLVLHNMHVLNAVDRQTLASMCRDQMRLPANPHLHLDVLQS